jgi:hypothetical protein
MRDECLNETLFGRLARWPSHAPSSMLGVSITTACVSLGVSQQDTGRVPVPAYRRCGRPRRSARRHRWGEIAHPQPADLGCTSASSHSSRRFLPQARGYIAGHGYANTFGRSLLPTGCVIPPGLYVVPGFSKGLPFAFSRQSTDIRATEAHKPMPVSHRNPQVELFGVFAAQQLYRLRLSRLLQFFRTHLLTPVLLLGHGVVVHGQFVNSCRLSSMQRFNLQSCSSSRPTRPVTVPG